MSSFNSAELGPAIVVSVKATGLAVAQIVVTCLAGFVLGRIGFLDKKAQKFLNNMNLKLFTPALVFSKIALTLSPEKLVNIAVVPLGFVLFTAVSAGIAGLTACAFRLRPGKRRFVICCSMAVNSNSLPIALIQSLSTAVPALKWTPDDTPNAMLARGISYLVLYSTLGLVWRWSFMVTYLEKADTLEATPSLDAEHGAGTPSASSEEALSIEKPSGDPASEGGTPGAKEGGTQQPPHTAPEGRAQRWRRLWRTISQFLTPPTYAAILSIFIAAITPLQNVVARATPITGAIDSMADIAVPMTLVVLGAYFVPEKTPQKTGDVSAASSTVELTTTPLDDSEANRTVLASVLARMILTPVVLYPFLLILAVFTPFKIFHDPIFILAMCLLIGGPTAVTMAQLTSAASASFERLVSRVIFWSYIVCLTPLTIAGTLVAILITMIPSRA
ncbi:hypothetical protein EXIGLDRAFT_778812 [Exidia glandulosa HHB12029]|uniref:Auxin efflux carrier n=1 Tax=Exidia glandulosa HHB12029 TaxID=1314781 RepID=A0A165CD51_EXIGL|nr:hypothetical protein EXIGLDRAFT_778812 [Exidia glandulosa HHB12029]